MADFNERKRVIAEISNALIEMLPEREAGQARLLSNHALGLIEELMEDCGEFTDRYEQSEELLMMLAEEIAKNPPDNTAGHLALELTGQDDWMVAE